MRDIGVGIFGLGTWKFDCATLESKVVQPEPDPLTGEIPNTLGVQIGVGGSIVNWAVGQLGSLFSGAAQESATQKIRSKLERQAAFQGAVRAHLFAKGYTVPCDPATRKQKVGWQWFISLTLVAASNLVVGEANGFITLQIGPFDGDEIPCDCPTQQSSVPAQKTQFHNVAGTLVAVRTSVPGSELVRDGVVYPAIAASPLDASVDLLGGVRVGGAPVPVEPVLAASVRSAATSECDCADGAAAGPALQASGEPLVRALADIKSALSAIEATLTTRGTPSAAR